MFYVGVSAKSRIMSVFKVFFLLVFVYFLRKLYVSGRAILALLRGQVSEEVHSRRRQAWQSQRRARGRSRGSGKSSEEVIEADYRVIK